VKGALLSAAAVVGVTGAAAFTIPLLVLTGAGGVSGGVAQTPPSAAALAEIPNFLIAHYEAAPSCTGLPWQIVAAIGEIESRHGEGRIDPTTGDTNPHIIGIALDGTHSAAVRVPPGGSPWHDDPIWDHAVGPMQFITSTWARWGIDANHDGVASPHNAYDAIATAGRYLCDGRPTLDSINQALLRYDSDPQYAARAIDIAIRYGMGAGGDPTSGPTPPAAAGGYPPGAVVHTDVAPVVAYALAQLGKPYVFDAAGPDAFDCSGLTMMAYRQIGFALPHYAESQARFGIGIDWHTSPIRPGDLLLFQGGDPLHDYGHVGIAIDAHYWIDAPHTGAVVEIGIIPLGSIEAVRRIGV
jgi:cell wall-associated NlpC family hydrolase